MKKFTHQTKAAWVTAFLSLFFIFAGVTRVSDWESGLPLTVFYVVLLINTFFSIRCFASITPPGKMQSIIDYTLVALYLATVVSIDNPTKFVFFSLLIFIVATLKYILLMLESPHRTLLKRKVGIDTLGILACAIALGALLAGFSTPALWLWSMAFVAANLYLFFVNPLYIVP